jgi:hypothetical protein
MQLSQNTLNILKNYAGINGNLLIKPGSQLRSVNEKGTILSIANIEETFDHEIAIYDLGEFLNTLALFENPQIVIDAEKQYVTIAGERSKVKYFLASVRVLSKKIIDFSEKNFSVSDPKVSFPLTEEDFGKLRKAASTFRFENLSFRSTNGNDISAVVTDQNIASSNSFELNLGTSSIENEIPFEMVVSFDQMKFIPDDYMCNLYVLPNGSKIAEFIAQNNDVRFFCGLDRSSNFGNVNGNQEEE